MLQISYLRGNHTTLRHLGDWQLRCNSSSTRYSYRINDSRDKGVHIFSRQTHLRCYAMSPTREASERARKAAFKAWETIRRKAAGKETELSTSTVPAPNSLELPETRQIAQPQKQNKQRTSRSKLKPSDYPKDWKEIGAEIRYRARNAEGQEQCECHGECLKHTGRCEEINRTWPKHRRRPGKVKIRLTVAHLCHTPKCDDKSHLKAMCEPCHLIYDLRCRQRGLRGEAAVIWATQRN